MGAMFGHNVPQPTQLSSVIPTEDGENQRVDLSAFFADTAKNLTAQDLSGLRNLD
jgi:hypothetical protein